MKYDVYWRLSDLIRLSRFLDLPLAVIIYSERQRVCLCVCVCLCECVRGSGTVFWCFYKDPDSVMARHTTDVSQFARYIYRVQAPSGDNLALFWEIEHCLSRRSSTVTLGDRALSLWGAVLLLLQWLTVYGNRALYVYSGLAHCQWIWTTG